jgi:hypothetical protein
MNFSNLNRLALTVAVSAALATISFSVAAQQQPEFSYLWERGHITVLDRPALEAHACECYQVVKMEFERLLKHGTAT